MGGVVPIIYNFPLNSANIDSSKKLGQSFFQKRTCYKPTHQENIFNGFGWIHDATQKPTTGVTVGLHDLQIALQQLLQKFTASHWDHTILSLLMIFRKDTPRICHWDVSREISSKYMAFKKNIGSFSYPYKIHKWIHLYICMVYLRIHARFVDPMGWCAGWKKQPNLYMVSIENI